MRGTQSLKRQALPAPSRIASSFEFLFPGIRPSRIPIGQMSVVPANASPAPTNPDSAIHFQLFATESAAPVSTSRPATKRTCCSSDQRVRMLVTTEPEVSNPRFDLIDRHVHRSGDVSCREPRRRPNITSCTGSLCSSAILMIFPCVLLLIGRSAGLRKRIRAVELCGQKRRRGG